MRHEPTSGHDDPSLHYRVTWHSVDEAGMAYERIFTERDQVWDFYQDMQGSARAYSVTWEHVAA